MRVPHPIPYQGSKRALAARILTYLPSDTHCLVEPFAGSAAVSLAAASAGRAQTFRLNDINQPLMDLWQEILRAPEEMANAYSRLWNAQRGQERAYYDQVRAQFNRTQSPALFLYLLARCVKASVRYNNAEQFNQSPDNRRLGARPDRMRAQLLAASALLIGRTELRSQNYTEMLTNVGARDVVYMDPPYQGVCGSRDRRYIGGIVSEEFANALCSLNAKNVAFILSYDGQTGRKSYGELLPAHLNLTHILLDAGSSSQATLLGRTERTVESLYLSPALAARLSEP